MLFLIVIQTQSFTTAVEEEALTTIISESGDLSVEIPRELVELGVYNSKEGIARVTSTLFNNADNLFPSGFPGDENE